MSKIKSPNKYDIVGSFLRPQKLRIARENFSNDLIDKSELTKIENECIDELVKKQKDLKLKIITDGEFRRTTWYLDFMWGFKGVSHHKTETGVPFHGVTAMVDDTYLSDVITVDNHPFVEHYKYLKQFEDEFTVAKLTIPAPAQFLQQLIFPSFLQNTRKYYKNTEKLIIDIANGYKKVIRDLYNEGCRNIQFDDCTWGVLVDPNANFILGTEDLNEIKQNFVDVNNLAIEQSDMTITTHVCRGNFNSSFACSGAYNSVAEYLFAKENVSAYFLEFDDERSGGFESLKYVKDNKKVVLGLISTKFPKLEDKNEIIKRIKEAAKYIPLERLALSPQCGFASCEVGNKLTEDEQWAKIELVREIAEEVWN